MRSFVRSTSWNLAWPIVRMPEGDVGENNGRWKTCSVAAVAAAAESHSDMSCRTPSFDHAMSKVEKKASAISRVSNPSAIETIVYHHNMFCNRVCYTSPEVEKGMPSKFPQTTTPLNLIHATSLPLLFFYSGFLLLPPPPPSLTSGSLSPRILSYHERDPVATQTHQDY